MISNRALLYSLTELGRRQALDLAEAVRSEGVGRIYASPIPRASETAEIVGQALGVHVELAEALREFDCGEYEGRSDTTAWAAHAAVMREWLELGHPDASMAGGESLTEVRARFESFVSDVVRHLRAERRVAGDDRQRAALLISHGGVLGCVLPQLLDGVHVATAAPAFLPNAGLIAADVGPDGALTGSLPVPSASRAPARRT